MHFSRRAGLKDVAELAKTSVATASRVLSGKGYASAEVTERVLDAARQLNYHPNLRARGLRQRSSHGIGLVIPNLLNAYYTALADTASQLLMEAGYHLLLSSTRDDPTLEQAILRDMIGQDVAGLMWVPCAPNADLLQTLRDQHIPALSIVRRVPGDLLDTVVFADLRGSYAATQHLIALGHRRIGYIGGDIRHSSNHARWQGYLAALRDADVPPDEGLVHVSVPPSMVGDRAVSRLLSLAPPPTAIFVASNALMPGVMRTLRQGRIAVPDQISLICFDDIEWFSFSVPPITAVQTSHTRLAEVAVTMLLQRMHEPEDEPRPPQFVEVDFKLVLRSSTAPPGIVPQAARKPATVDRIGL